MFETLYFMAKQNEADVVMCDAVTEYENGEQSSDTITQLTEDAVLTKEMFTPTLLMEMAGSVWRCIYRTNQLWEHGNSFDTDLNFQKIEYSIYMLSDMLIKWCI